MNQPISSLLVGENGEIYIFVSATSTNTSLVIKDQVLKRIKTDKTNGIFLWENDNKIDKNILRKAEIRTIYEAYKILQAEGERNVEDIFKSVKNNKKGIIDSNTDSNQTIDEIKAKFQKRIENLKYNFKNNNGKSVEEVLKNSANPADEAPAPEVSSAEGAPAEDSEEETPPLSLEKTINIKHAWVKKQIETYKETNPSFDYKKPTLNDIKGILAKYENTDFSKKKNIPENSALIIYAIQIALKYMDFEVDVVDGIYGDNTKRALLKLQNDNFLNNEKLKADGIPGPNTIGTIIELIK